MQYVSPISFLPIKEDAMVTPKDLVIAKHKLMAEFELMGTTTIKIGEKEMSRNDVLKLFDQIDLSGDMEYHALVASDPVLLRFLEHNEIQAGETFCVPEEKITPEFIAWISPYFKNSFKKCILFCFRNQYTVEFHQLVDGPMWMTETDTWDAWSGIEDYLMLLLKKLAANNAANNHRPGEVSKYTSYHLTQMMGALPVDRFAPFLSAYAYEMMRYAIWAFNKKDKEWGLQVIEFAKSLPVDDDTMQALVNKENEMVGIMNARTKKTRRLDMDNPWVLIRLVLLALYLFSRLATCHTVY